MTDATTSAPPPATTSPQGPGLPAEPSFARTFLLPALWVLLVPIVGLAFTSFQLASWSREANGDIGAAAVSLCGPLGFFNTPDGADASFCKHLLQFVWAQRLSAALLLIALAAAGVLGFSLRWASRSPKSQHQGFRLGWITLRAFAVPHVIGQGVILVFLSFWVTALTLHVYVVKLILAVALIALAGMAMALKALFARSSFVPAEQGLVVQEKDAPVFFANVKELAQRVGTAPPTNVVLGIDDNFFVTEMPIDTYDRIPTRDDPRQNTRRVQGRTLYASLSLMRALSKPEANAVLAHELAHFAQGDTSQSRQLNPLLARFSAYMQTLSGTMTFGVGSCMIAYRALFERIAQRHSRTAEFAADRVSAQVVGAEPTGRALWKVAAYATYRARTEGKLFESMQKHGELKLAERVSQGFTSFVADPDARTRLVADVLAMGTPHPFDSHPPLQQRLQNVGASAPGGDALLLLAERPAETLCDEIQGVTELEQQLWRAYEAAFAENHDFAIAVRLQPKTPEEIAHVERHFPASEHSSKDGTYRLNWEKLTLPDGVDVPYRTIKTAEHKELFGGMGLILETIAGEKHTIKLKTFPDQGQGLLGAFGNFYQRHNVSTAEAEAQPAR